MSTAKQGNIFSWAAEASTNGVPSLNQAIPDGDNFGDSGDAFNHAPWRDFIISCYGCEEFRKDIVKLCNQHMLRGRALKTNNRGKVLLWKASFKGLNPVVKTKYEIIGDFKDIPIFYATEASRVDANALTPERFKCICRPIIVPEMMLARRVPATSASIGYESLVQDFQSLIDAKDTIDTFNTGKLESVDKLDLKDRALTTSATHKKLAEDMKKHERYLNMAAETEEMWMEFIGLADSLTIGDVWLNVPAMYSATVSQKEIYESCEEMFPGTIFWAGVHCMMTDVANKKRASFVPADQQQKFLNSNFYSDFKRKQNARNLLETKTDAYVKLLQGAVPVMAAYIRTGSNLSVSEVGVMDALEQRIKKNIAETAITAEALKDGKTSSSHKAIIESFKLDAETLIKKLSG